MLSTIAPTPEQRDAIGAFMAGGDLAVVAGAGSGKTSTIKLMAEAAMAADDRSGEQGLYLAFNRSIVEEAKRKMPSNIRVKTIHSLAWRATEPEFIERLNQAKRQRSDVVARILGMSPINVTIHYPAQFDGDAGLPPVTRTLTPSYLAGAVLAGIKKFCQSDDFTPDRHHIPYLDGIDPVGPTGRRTFGNNDRVSAMLEPFLVAAWRDLSRTNGDLRYDHAHYLKSFELSQPNLGVDFIMFDEAQDVSPVFASIVLGQMEFGTQIVMVGDPNQSIYEWNGAIDAFKKLPASCARTPLTHSFRFGPEIAAVANSLLDDLGAEMRLVGAGPASSRVGPVDDPDAVLCRTNAQAVAETIRLQSAGVPVFLMGGASDVRNFAFAARDLMNKGHTNHADLGCFGSWNEAVEYVMRDPDGADLKMLTKLVVEYGVDTILVATQNMPKHEPSGTHVVVSTAHKAKGREWPTVRLAEDFPARPDSKPLAADELRLLYVAVTRAKVGLDLSAAKYFNDASGE